MAQGAVHPLAAVFPVADIMQQCHRTLAEALVDNDAGRLARL